MHCITACEDYTKACIKRQKTSMLWKDIGAYNDILKCVYIRMYISERGWKLAFH